MAAPIVAGGVAVLASALVAVKRRASRQYGIEKDDSARHGGRDAGRTTSCSHRQQHAPRGAGIGAVVVTDGANPSVAVAQGQPSLRSLAATSSGSLVALYTPGGELIVAQQCGAPELQRWALATVRAPAQEDAPLGEVRLPFFPAASLFSVVRKGTLISFRSVGAGGRLLRAVRGRRLPGIGGHALGDSQSWWQEDAGLLVSCAHGGEVLSLRAEEVRVVSKTDIRTTERLHAAQLRGVTFELARSQEHLQQLRASADEATAAFQEHCCQASFQESQLVRQMKACIAAEAQARSMADSAWTLLQGQTQDLAEVTAQKQAAAASAGRAARRAGRLQGLLQQVRSQVQDHQTAQAASDASLQGLSEERNRLDSALSTIQMQLTQANASVTREAARCKISLSPQAACTAAKAARLSPQRPPSANAGFSKGVEFSADAGSNTEHDSGLESARSGATCYSDFSSDAEGWTGGGGHSSPETAHAADMLGSPVDVPRKRDMTAVELGFSPELVPHKGDPGKLKDSFRDVQLPGGGLAALGAGTPEIREPGRLRTTWDRRRLTGDGKPEGEGGALADGGCMATKGTAAASKTSADGVGLARVAAASEAATAPEAASTDTPEDAAGSGTGRQDGASGSGVGDVSATKEVPDIDPPVGRPVDGGSPHSANGDENAPPSNAATPAAQRLRWVNINGESDSCSDVSDSEAADTVPPLRLLYSGGRRSLHFSNVAYNSMTDGSAGSESEASEEASDKHCSAADNNGGEGGGENSRRAGVVLSTKLGPEPVYKAGGEQRSPLRAFLRRHVQWGGR